MRPDDDRRLPQTGGGIVYLLVLAMAVVGLVITVFGAWRVGVGWLGSGLLVASVARAVCSERGAGMLRVRQKRSDVLMLVVVGIALIALAVVIPNQPPR